MRIKSFSRRAAGLAGCVALMAAITTAAATSNAARSLSAKQYLANLSSSQYGKRHAAVRYFARTGEASRAMLEAALKHTQSPQLRRTLLTVLRKIRLTNLAGATPITLHMEKATPKQILAAIAKQTGARFVTQPANMLAGGRPLLDRRINFNVSHMSFWQCIETLRAKTGIGCVADDDTAGQRLMVLREVGKTSPPAQVEGAFMTEAASATAQFTQTLSPDTANPAPVAKTANITFKVFAEPKVIMLMRGAPVIDKIITANGKQLSMPASPVGADAANLAGSPHAWTATVALPPSATRGGRVKSLEAHWKAIIATGTLRWVIPRSDLFKKQTFLLGNTTLTFSGLTFQGPPYRCMATIAMKANAVDLTKAGRHTYNLEYVNSAVNGDRWLRDCPGLLAEKRTHVPVAMGTGITATSEPRYWDLAKGYTVKTAVGPKAHLVIVFNTGIKNVTVPVRLRHLRLP